MYVPIRTAAPIGITSFAKRTVRTSSAPEFFIICSISVKIIAHVYNDDRQQNEQKLAGNRLPAKSNGSALWDRYWDWNRNRASS